MRPTLASAAPAIVRSRLPAAAFRKNINYS
jgi:hypothetical protein